MAAYLKLDHVTKSFRRGSVQTDVLDDINLDISKGEFVSIIGHSGCGKSTLLNLVAGLTRVTSGGVLLEQCEVNAPGPERAVVFQNHSLLPWLTVYDNVRLAVDKVHKGKLKTWRHDWTLHNLALVRMEAAEFLSLAVLNALLIAVASLASGGAPSRVYAEFWPYLLPLHAAVSWTYLMVPLVLVGQSPMMGLTRLSVDADQPERRMAFAVLHLISAAAFPLSFLCMVLTPDHRTLAELLSGQEILQMPYARMR